MRVIGELLRILLIIFLTCMTVVLLWQLPWFLLFFLLIPAALSWWFWPYSSTALSYFVGALFGTILTANSFIAAVDAPAGFLSFLWIPLIWGPAGVIVKRLEVLVIAVWKGRRESFDLPESK